MTDVTQTPADTTTSATTTDAAAAPGAGAEVAATTTGAAPAGDGAAVVETSVLGGDVTEESGEAAAAEEAGEAEKTPEGPPEKYELKLEGTELNQEAVAAAEPVLRELGLTNDQANTLMPVAQKLVTDTQQATVQQLIDAGEQQKKDWKDQFLADPEIGGAKREETEHLAAKGLDALGFTAGHPFRKALTESGFGNHPDMIRAFRKVGQIVGEDGQFVRGDSAAPVQRSAAEILYPSKS